MMPIEPCLVMYLVVLLIGPYSCHATSQAPPVPIIAPRSMAALERESIEAARKAAGGVRESEPSVAANQSTQKRTTPTRSRFEADAIASTRRSANAIASARKSKPKPAGKTRTATVGKPEAATVVVDVPHVVKPMSSPTACIAIISDLCSYGMLPLAFGMAAAGGTGPAPASIVLLVFAALSWYSSVSFARASQSMLVHLAPAGDGASTASLGAIWERTMPLGKVTNFIPDVCCLGLTVGCLLCYSAFLGDLFTAVLSGFTWVPEILRRRWSVVLLLHAGPVLWLCLKKDLDALKQTNMAGLMGICYTVLFVGKRLLDKSYANGGRFYDLMPSNLQPATQIGFKYQSDSMLGFVNDVPPMLVNSKALLMLMNMCCVAYACQYNAVKYYMELKDRNLTKAKQVMAGGIGGTTLVFWSTMILGYATFGRNAQALLLSSYHESQDFPATVARLLTGTALISGFALQFAGLKAALFSLTRLDQPGTQDREFRQDSLSALCVAAIALGACFVTQHECAKAIGIVGPIFGSIVVYIFPALINNQLLARMDKNGQPLAQKFFMGEQIFNYCLVLLGTAFAVLGSWASQSK